MTDIVFDLESDGLLDTVSKVHSLQIGDVDDTDAVVYADWPGCRPIAEGLERVRNATRVIGQNLISYDHPVMEKFFPGVLRQEQVVDTLVMARLKFPEERSHSLKTWGEKLKVLKGSFEGPWDVLTQQMIDYAAQDVIVTRAMYHALKEVETWGESLALEHSVAWAIAAQERNGWRLDVEGAQRLDAELRGEVAALEAKLKAAFPPIERTLTIIPKVNQPKRGYVKGQMFVKRWTEELNPSSRQQLAERLVLAGWKPKEMGANGHPTLDEKTLAELKIPEAPLVLAYFNATKLLGALSDGKSAWLKLVKPNGRVYGRVNPNGAVTGRMTHSGPNMANVPKDKRVRSLWLPREGWKLVGCDAEGLEARILCHYLRPYDDGNMERIILSGKSSDRTDIHSLNLKALIDSQPTKLVSDVAWGEKFGPARDTTKNIYYALMFGARDPKLGSMLKLIQRAVGQPVSKVPNKELGVLVRRALSKSMIGLDKLMAALEKRKAERGYLTGLDGRRLNVRKANAILNTLCQGGGACVMKRALAIFMDSAIVHENWPDMGLVGNIHDELEVECAPELAEAIGAELAESIRLAGVALGVRCPLAGKAAVGNNWSEVH